MMVVRYRRRFLRAVLGLSFLFLLVVAIYEALVAVFWRFPLETLIVLGVFAVCGVALVLCAGELVVVGWIVDFLAEIRMPGIQAKPIPLEYQRVGEIIVVKLRDNIITLQQCQSVQKQLKRLIGEHHCNFVLDFSSAEKISKRFRGVMVYIMKAARREAGKRGTPYRVTALPRGSVFQVFDNSQRAVEEMSQHDEQGWVVLCSVPVGIRAFSGLT
jgi:hypothetical protein